MNTGTNRRNFLAHTAALAGVTWTASNATTHAQPIKSAAGPLPGATTAPLNPTEPLKGASAEPVPLAPPDKQPPNLKVPQVAAKKVGWAVVGLGELALEEIMPAFAACEWSECVALVSGHPEKARKVAEMYNISPDGIYTYENYDDLAKNPKVDIIYIVLPNSMHAEYTIRGLKAGKHVLCEKPMATSVKECEQMIMAAADAKKKLMIAYRLHYEPLNRKVMELCADKAYGPVKIFEASNCQNVQPPNIRLSKTLGGGPLGDVGVYCINAARYVIGEEPVEVTAISHQPADDPRFREVAESVAFTLRYPSGVLAHCDCSFGSTESRRFRVTCAEGFIEMDPAFSYRGLRLRVKSGDAKKGTAQNAELPIEQVDHFTAEMDACSKCILDDTEPQTPGKMGLADMRIVAAIEEAAQTGRAAKIGA